MTWTTRRRFIERSLQLGASALAAGSPLAVRAAEPLTTAEFEKLHKDLQPPENELWRSIPWQMSILEARELAAKEKKPLVMRVPGWPSARLCLKQRHHRPCVDPQRADNR